ncbi:unnamed protein product [Calypogeia fissa]
MAVTDRLNVLFWITLLLPLLCLGFSEDNPTDQRVLVLLDDLSLKASHSIFFKSLASRGYDLDFKLTDDSSLALHRYGEYLYDALILFAPSVEDLGGSLDAASVLAFVDSGHDLVLAADTHTSDLVRDIATECGIDFDDEADSVVIDHINFAVDSGDDHTVVVGGDLIDAPVLIGTAAVEAPVLFRGIGHSLNPESELVVQVLSASPSAFSANPNAELTSPPALTGTSIGLVSVVQARNNARVLISGSLDFFSDKFFKSPVQQPGSSTRHAKSGNEQVATELSKWTFHERGHLKAVNVLYHKIGEQVEPAVLRISDEVEFSVDIFEWTGQEWQPYKADDVQVQFYMMSPYVLKGLTHNNKGAFSTAFKVPDVYGVFQFKVEYNRLGYARLSLSKQIPVRPFRHNEYERFITSAFPYYGGSFSMMAGFFIFGIFFLYHK